MVTMEGLENKLNGVSVGDIIMLQSPVIEVSGYVVDFGPKSVKISHENPFSEKSNKLLPDYRTCCLVGDRYYLLRHFGSYKILEKYNPEKNP